MEREKKIVLLCNPLAGGRWKELAKILDSREARHVRRIVTDSVEDIGPALTSLGDEAELICIYGGDGTIQRILDQIRWNNGGAVEHKLAFIGGGTMNVTASWCGLGGSPASSFRQIVRDFNSGQLLFKEVPLLVVRHGAQLHHGFTFGMGPIVRVLDAYDRGTRGKTAALGMAVGALSALWLKWPNSFRALLQGMDASIAVDDRPLGYNRFAAVFCNVTGYINPGVRPFARPRTRDTFHCGAYSVTPRELSVVLPLVARGRLPIDPKSLLKPISAWRQIALSFVQPDAFPTDPRYFNGTAKRCEIETAERIFTVDGEIMHLQQEKVSIELGPRIQLAVSPTVELHPTVRLAAGVTSQLDRRSSG